MINRRHQCPAQWVSETAEHWWAGLGMSTVGWAATPRSGCRRASLGRQHLSRDGSWRTQLGFSLQQTSLGPGISWRQGTEAGVGPRTAKSLGPVGEHWGGRGPRTPCLLSGPLLWRNAIIICVHQLASQDLCCLRVPSPIHSSRQGRRVTVILFYSKTLSAHSGFRAGQLSLTGTHGQGLCLSLRADFLGNVFTFLIQSFRKILPRLNRNYW